MEEKVIFMANGGETFIDVRPIGGEIPFQSFQFDTHLEGSPPDDIYNLYKWMQVIIPKIEHGWRILAPID